MSSSRWGPPVKSTAGDISGASPEIDFATAPIPPPQPMNSLASEESLGSSIAVGVTDPQPPPPPPPELPADADFEYIAGVEWGPRRTEDGYDTDQELVPQPMPERTDSCGCQRPDNDSGSGEGMACVDDTCILFACREECRKNCEAGESCGNRRIQRGQFKGLTVFDAGSKGKGLQLEEACVLGDILTEYVGRAVKQTALGRLFRRYKLDRMLYIMALDSGVYLDARTKGGLARYINHSCDPNCKVERWKVRGILRAAVVALKDLSAGEELTFDYQWERQRGRATTKCHCGSANCRGTLELAKSLEEQREQQELEGHWKKMTVAADQNIINRTVQVFSQEHQEYFWGEVTGYDAEKKLHSILSSHDLNEAWEDLSKEDWRILDEEFADQNNFCIAKKIQQRPSTSAAPTSLLQANHNPANANGTSSSLSSSLQVPPTKYFLYIQTPIKQIFWSKHWIERCERNCQVQVQAQQMARPPLPPVLDDPEDVEKYQALDQSRDGTVWKLTISGSNVPAAHSFLEKSAVSLQKKVELETLQQAQALAAPTVTRVLSANTAPSSLDVHEVVIPRMIVDGVKRRLPSVREKCRSVTIVFAASESKSKQFSRLIMEGSLLSDIEVAKEHVWTLLIELCDAADAPATPNKMYRDLGFLGGALSNAQFRLLCGAPKDSLRAQAKEDLQRSPFFASFESSYRCTVWVQSDEDKGRINANNRIVDEATPESPRKVFFGCHPKEVPRLWGLVQSRAAELARGVKFLYLGLDRVYQQLMMKNGGQFFEYVKKVVGAAVTIDSMTGDHLRIDGRSQSDDWLSEGAQPEMTEDERASMAEELVRLQIELYRDHCIRQQSWMCGRDWTLVASSTVAPNNSDSKQSIQSLGNLDSRTTAQGCLELSEIVAHLQLPANVAAHAAIILYRFVSAKGSSDTQIKTREAVLACIFLANKAQKATKWKRLDAVLEAGYKTFYPGTKFDRNQEAVVVLEDKVIAAEKEILQTLDYDIFWCETEGILVVATGAGKHKESFVESVFALAFSGPVLAAGPELWLKYGTEYVFAAAAAFLKANLEDLLPPMGLIPLKVSQAAEVLVQSAKIGRSSSVKMPSHPLVAGKKERVEKYLPRIKEACVEIMKKSILSRSPAVLAVSSEIEQRYRIIGERSCRRHTIRGVIRDVVQDHIVPIIDGIAAESTCLIFLAESAQDGAEDIVLEGPWRAVAIADHLLRSATKDITSLPPSVDSTAELQEGNKIQAKIQSGVLGVSDIQTTDDWEGTIQANEPDQKVSGHRVGGKCALAGKIPESSLRESGLRWWIPPRHGPSPSGNIQDMFSIRSSPSQQLDALSRLTTAFVGQSESFPLLTSRLVRAPEGGGDRAVAVSIQRWPSEKVSNKELEASEKSKGKRMQMGFSAAALQEMQLLRQLHGLIPSPQGHPNFILPVGVAVPGNDDLKNHVSPAAGDVGSSSASMDDPMFSLFRSSEENEKAAQKAKKRKSGPHLVFHPTPYVLQRFMSRKTQKSDEFSISPGILASWFHDLLSALVHCHSNHVVLKNIQPDQILVDHSGVAKLGGLYRATVLPPDERRKPINALKAAVKSKIKKKDAEDDYSNNPYAAPEILMGCPKFSKESDIWSMGCLLATLVLNKPLFVGKDRAALLTSQFKIVGYPGKDNYEEGAKYPYYKKPEKGAKKYRRNVEKAMEHMLKENHSQDSKVIDLLARMLHLDPEKRCTAAEALGHDFLVEYAENCNSEAFRQSYVADWMALKEMLLRMGDSVKEKERNRKRKAMMLAATKTSNDDNGDDLYDMDEIFDDEEPAKKQKIGTLQ